MSLPLSYLATHKDIDSAWKAYNADNPHARISRKDYRALVGERKATGERFTVSQWTPPPPEDDDLQRILIVPDSHIPFEDKRAFDLMLRAAHEFRPDRIVIIGDFADFFQISFHPKDNRGAPTFKEEIAAVNDRLDQLDAIDSVWGKDYLAGNHEYRLDRYLMANQSALVDLEDWTVAKLLNLEERGWTFTPYQQSIRIGKCFFTHDEGSSGNQAHMKARSTFGSNVVIGHCHSLGISYQGNAAGEQHAGFSVGWLGNLPDVTYMHHVKAQRWTHGFGIAHHQLSTGYMFLQPIPIINYTCCINGKLIT